MSVSEHRKRLYETLPENSLVICHAGVPLHTNEDHYYHPFEANSQFFWLTGLERENMVFLAAKVNGETQELLFIEPVDPNLERWTGKMPTAEEASAASGIEQVRMVGDLSAVIGRYMGRYRIEQVFFDLYRCGENDLPDLNVLKAKEFTEKYLAAALRDLHAACVPLREVKDAEEVALIREAIGITRQGLDRVMKTLKPGMKEYQAQAEFEYACRALGAEKLAFPTISASGLNGCMMHYETNRDEIRDGSLLLMDLGAKYGNYCSDITRTFPADGAYSPRQKEVYNLVLKANLAVAEAALSLGAGRTQLTDEIDPLAGVELLVRRGDAVQPGQPIARLYAKKKATCLPAAAEMVVSALAQTETPPAERPSILAQF